MIKKILLPIIAIILLSSCANKFSLQKRKYNKGFYFANSKNTKHNDLASNTKNTNAKKLPTKIYVETIENKIEAEIKKQPISKNSLINYTLTDKKVETKKNVTATASKKNIIVAKIFKELKLTHLKNKVAKSKKASSSDTNLIVLVILSLFPILCLIAVYLKDGKSITLNFWIDLLLHLTIIGEIIFALLVVLDVVNLA